MNELEQLKQRVKNLEQFIEKLNFTREIPLGFEQALLGRGFVKSGTSNVLQVNTGGTGASTLTGILKGNGTGAFTAVVPLSGSGTFYAAASSGGTVNVRFDYTDGVITART